MATISSNDWIAIGTVGLALAAFVALLFEPFRRWIKRPELTIAEVSNHRPDFLRLKADVTARVRLVSSDGKTDSASGHTQYVFAYYIQLHIGNKQGRWRGMWQRDPAEETEVYMESIKMKKGSRFVPYLLILPQNLCWAYMEDGGERAFYYPKIPAGSKRPCSLCGFTHADSQKEPPRTCLNTTIRMVSEEAHTITPGSYELELTVSAKNAKPVKAILALNFGGKWFEDPDEMWSQGLSAKTLKA